MSSEMKILKVWKLLSTMTLVIGLLLMTLKIYEDSEPGAIPLLLIVAGVGGYIFTQFKLRSPG